MSDTDGNANSTFAIGGSRSRVESNNNSVNIIGSKIIGDSALFGAFMAVNIDTSIYSYEEPQGSQPNVKGASNNSFIVRDSEISGGSIMAVRYSHNEANAGDLSNAPYEHNSVEISNSKFDGTDIFGVRICTYSASDDSFTGYEGYGQYNTVTIGENVTKTDGSILDLNNLYEGFAKDMSKAYLGNTLNPHSLVKTKNFGGFQNLNFFINDNILDDLKNGQAFISITGENSTKLHSNVNNSEFGNAKESANTNITLLCKYKRRFREF
ncbi:hypothetical protein [Campylobacter sp. US33a]|uniref:hypothetical protein n=1 Tax=Campylobacter sp. US33a TaxID=2498120 RepID=UPI00106830C2|nr:hypothetical protein [Campylobacter sp. US33a]TEY02017.1 hypothetical protein ELQ16_06595 [Campylobacter sp. US33a]